MPIYKVQWNYKSSLGGPFMMGDQIEMKEDLAEAINRDSPGVLTSLRLPMIAEGGINRSMGGPENAKVVTTHGHGKQDPSTGSASSPTGSGNGAGKNKGD